MAPKLFNRFKVKLKTEDPDDDDTPLAAVLGTQMNQGGDQGAPLSTFQQERLLREAQAEAALAAQALSGGARGATQRATGPAGAGQRRTVTVAAPPPPPRDGAAAGSLAGIKLEDLQLSIQRYQPSAEALVPPIDTSVHPAPKAEVKPEHSSNGNATASAGDDDDVKDASLLTAARPAPLLGGNKGTDFLHLDDAERAKANRSNASFLLNADGTQRYFEQSQLSWMQLPRLPSAPALGRSLPAQQARELLDILPPGPIGKLRVHRSGKVTLVFDNVPASAAPNVVYDVRLTGASSQGPSEQIAQSLMAIIPDPNATGEEALQCYDLGPVTQKLVCTPRIDDI